MDLHFFTDLLGNLDFFMMHSFFDLDLFFDDRDLFDVGLGEQILVTVRSKAGVDQRNRLFLRTTIIQSYVLKANQGVP